MTAHYLRGTTSYRAALAALAVIAFGATNLHSARAADPDATANVTERPDAARPDLSVPNLAAPQGATVTAAPTSMLVSAPSDVPLTGTQSGADGTQPSNRALERQLRHLHTMDTALPQAHFAAGRAAQTVSAQTGGAFVISDNKIQATTQLAGYQRAPLPDQDRQAPPVAENTDPRLRPAFFPRMVATTSSAFMKGSDLETDQSERQKPSGGFSLDIPMR